MAAPNQELVFTRPQAWSGGEYELALELGPTDDGRARRALEAVWSFGALHGCYLETDLEPADQPRVSPADLDDCLRGTATLPSGKIVVCSTIFVREEGRPDWLYFGLPLGSLGAAYPVGAFPFEDHRDLSWREPLDGWLRALAAHVHARVPFQLGLIGWTDRAPDTAEIVAEEGVPEDRWLGYLLPVGDGLEWHAPNQGAPISLAAQ